MPSSQRALVGLFFIIFVSAGTYFYVQGQLSEAVDNLTVDFSSLKVEGIRLFPPEVNLTLTYIVRNTGDMDFDISIDGRLLYGETLLSPLVVERQHVDAKGSNPVKVDITLSGSLLQALGGYSDEAEYRMEGMITATHRFMGLVPVTVNKPLS